MGLLSLLEAKRDSDHLAYRFVSLDNEPQLLSYKQLFERSAWIASNLRQSGVLPEDRVLILMSQGLDYLLAFWGCVAAQAIAIPLYPPKTPSQITRALSIIRDAKAKYIICDEGKTQEVISYLKTITDFRASNIGTITQLSKDTGVRIKTSADDSKIAFLQYTSGSTGVSKGVMVAHGNLKYNLEMLHQGFGITPSESHLVSWLPLFHDMGLIGKALLSVYSGISLTLMSPSQFVKSPLFWLEVITRYGGTHTCSPNFAFDLCVDALTHSSYQPELNLSSWKMALNGAEPIRHQTFVRFIKAFQPQGFNPAACYAGYGMAEATLYVSGSDSFKGIVTETIDELVLRNDFRAISCDKGDNLKVIVSCGKPRMDEKIYIVNPETLTKLPPRYIGEIWVKGLNVCQGYWSKPQETQEIFNAYIENDRIGPCLRTGDLGYVNEQGDLFVVGRLKDLIIINGKNYAPQDIEAAIEESCELVDKNGVVAFSIDKSDKEHLIIVIEFHASMSTALREKLTSDIKYVSFSQFQLSPLEVVFVGKGGILKTTSGKLQRRDCKLKYLGGDLK